ncbi:1241_t:CDS:2, partial [Acaulospora morrowiae]
PKLAKKQQQKNEVTEAPKDSTMKTATLETTASTPTHQKPKKATHEEKIQELWSDEQEAHKYIRIDDSDAEMEGMETDNNNWKSKTGEEEQ